MAQFEAIITAPRFRREAIDVAQGIFAAAPRIYTLTDALGSVVAHTGATGIVLPRYRYARYGESLNLAFGIVMDADAGLT